MHTYKIQEKTDIEKILDYIIERNPEGCKKLLLLNGYTRFTTIRDLQLSLLEYVKKHDNAIAELVKEHPDYDLIVSEYKSAFPASETKQARTKKKKSSEVKTVTVDFNLMVQLLMFLVCVWLVLKIFSKD